MSKIEERLRSVNAHVAPYANDLVRGWCHEGADTLKACEQALRAILPRNVAVNNPNVADDEEMPLNVTIGELRPVAAALAKLEGAK